jgi:BlaI family penicillinase repressor
MAAKFAEVSEAELIVLRTLWEKSPGTVRDIRARLRGPQRRWAYTTLQTLLTRLEAKGYLRTDKSEQAHVFHVAVTRERFLARCLRVVADEVCDGTATPLVMALIKGSRFSAEEVARFRRLIDEVDPKKAQAVSKA